MQTYDFLMIALMAGAVLFGLWKGLAWQIASLAAIFVSYFVAMNFRGTVAGVISAEPPWDRFLAMFILFVATSLVIWVLFGLVKRTIERMHLTTFDRQIGGLLGAVKGAVLCIIVTLFAVSLLGDQTRRTICTSTSGNVIAHTLSKLDGVVPSEIGQYIDPYIDRFNDAMEEHQENGTQQAEQNGLYLNREDFAPYEPLPVSPWGGNWQDGMTTTPNTDGIRVGPIERVGQLQPSIPRNNEHRFQSSGATWTLPNQSPNPDSGGTNPPDRNWPRAADSLIETARQLGLPKRR